MARTPEIKPAPDFTFGAVNSLPGTPQQRKLVGAVFTGPALGPLAAMAGSWAGKGFNTIFRPQSTRTPTKLPIPGNGPNDNILELNLTSEQTTFTPIPGTIPNRGEGPTQGDVDLVGMVYLQSVQDVTEGPATGIHIEPGLWVVVPTTVAPSQPATVARLASIPHGTTVNAQGTTTTANTPPTIPPVNITPTSVTTGAIVPPGTFPSQTAAKTDTFRVPQDLTAFISAGTITQQILDDPNEVLRSITSRQTITAHTEVSISTEVQAPLVAGGGVANIAFLQNVGQPQDPPPGGPNARSAKMTATFWIERVQKDVTLLPWKPGDADIQIPLVDGLAAVVTPVLTIRPAMAIGAAKKITITFTQLQYSQTVILDFNTLNWPHVSVATLVPDLIELSATALNG